jgi:excisionase family DNA binding protein
MANSETEMIFTPRWYTVAQVAQLLNYGKSKVRMLIMTGQLRSIKDGPARRILPEWVEAYVQDRAKAADDIWSRRRANGEGSIFPYHNGFAAYVWITTPSGKRQRRYVYGRTREIVHSRWIELTRKAARGPVATKVPTVGQFLHQWLEEIVAPNLAPLTSATYESHVKNYIEPGIGALRLDRVRVADVQVWLNHLATQCQCCAQGKDVRRALRGTARCCALGKCCHRVASPRTIKDVRTVLRQRCTRRCVRN